MGNFLYSCHIQRINRGELHRAAGIIERYLDQHQLGVDLMLAHAEAVTFDYDNCIGNVPGA